MTKRYHKGNQNPYIEEEQTTQWPKDTTRVIRIRISKKNRQHNDQKKIYKKTNNDQQNTYKIKDRVTRTPLKTGGELRCSGRVGGSCSTSETRRVNLVTNPVISHERGKDREVFTKIYHLNREKNIYTV